MTHLLSLLLLAGLGVQAELSDGQSWEGELQQLTNDQVILQVKGVDRRLAPAEIRKLTFDAEAAPASTGPLVATIGGSQFRVKQQVRLGRDEASFYLETGGTMTTSMEALSWIRNVPRTKELDEQWKEITDSVAKEDFLVINRQGNLDYLAGVIMGLDASTLAFEYSGNKLDVPLDRVAGIVFAKRGPKPGGVRAMVRTVDGSVWQLHGLTLDNDEFRLAGISGIVARLPVAQLNSIEFFRPGMVYLADLQPDVFVYRPFVSSSATEPSLQKLAEPRLDESFQGGLLQVKTETGSLREFRRGVALKSRSELTYRLANQYQRFRATVGIDPEASALGNVELKLLADEEEVFSRSVKQSEPAFDVDVSLSGVKRMKIVVDFGKHLDIGDRLHLGDARFIK